MSESRTSEVLVVLPTLGARLDTLTETLKSIEAQRENVSLHLVVVCPKNATEARTLAQEFNATIVDDPGTGISDAINLGVAAHRGEKFYAWMGDDDLFRPNGLKTLIQLIGTDETNVVAYGACDYIDHNGQIIYTNAAGKLAQFLLPWGPDLIPHPGSIIRLKQLLNSGGFNPQLKYAMDLDMFLRLRKTGNFVSTKVPVSAFRWHVESLTVANRLNSSLESERVKKNHLPKYLKPFSFLWALPIRWASSLAAQRVSAKAKKLPRFED